MAIIEDSRNFKSKVEPSMMRKKQRDYTIPVRLNQFLSFSFRHSELQQDQAQVQHHQATLLKSIRSNSDRSRGREAKMINKISSLTSLSLVLKESGDERSRAAVKQKHSSHRLMIFVLALTASMSAIKFCHCDTQTSSSSSNTGGQQQVVASSPKSFMNNDIRQVQQVPAGSSLTSNSRLSNRVPYKEHLLSSLADNIEQQHFKTKPSRMFPSRQTRPSKLDLPDSYIELDSPASSSGQYSSSSHQHQHKNKSIKKADEGLRQILQMHESVIRRQPSPPLNTQQSLKPSSPERARFKVWREISRSPVRVASSLIKPNKVVSQVLSYITPLVGTKLLDSAAILSGSSSTGDNNNKFNTTNPFRIIKLNPFVGRSGGNYATFSNEYNIFGPLRSIQPVLSSSPYRPSKSAQSSGSSDEPAISSTLVEGNTNSLIDMKSPINENSDEIKDLMADSSSLSSIVSNSPLWTSGSGSSSTSDETIGLSESPSSSATKLITPTTSTSATRLPTKSLKPPRASFWFKNSANQIAQNYFQNSFRDLLTLSQLPILSSSSISTAPSILEKKHSSAKKNKNSPKTPLDEFRRRAVEELYRYAYILATGVKNKRDPLLALASHPGLPTSKLTNKRGVFNQRSLNQLTGTNQTELVNLVHKLRSLLSGPINRARPRGVMWDMATDPSLAVTVFHLLERASVALPLGFMLMPFVRMIRNPMNGVDFGKLLPPRASHRSVDYEELAKRLDIVDKMLSRALRSTHRESFVGK